MGMEAARITKTVQSSQQAKDLAPRLSSANARHKVRPDLLLQGFPGPLAAVEA